MLKKVPPLVCPQCGSERVSPGFNKRKGRAYVRDGRIFCYECNKVTNANGKVSKHNFKSHVFPTEDGNG